VPAQSTEPQPAPHQEESTVTAALGETPAQITAQLIEEIRQQLSRVNDLNDHLAAANNTLAVQVSQTQDYVTANGGTTETAAALDAAGGVVREIGSHVGSASDAVAKAADSALAADAGLRPAQDAEDQLTAAGADGRFVAPATSD
jgi:methyl-accepting chemotaxis protein